MFTAFNLSPVTVLRSPLLLRRPLSFANLLFLAELLHKLLIAPNQLVETLGRWYRTRWRVNQPLSSSSIASFYPSVFFARFKRGKGGMYALVLPTFHRPVSYEADSLDR